MSAWRLWTGLLLAPSAWFVQLAIDTPVLSHACYPHDEPHHGSVAGLMTGVVTVDAVTLALALGGVAVAWSTWRRTAREKAGGGPEVMASGDGRSRFMAMAGVLSGALIAVAVLYIGLVHALLPECGL